MDSCRTKSPHVMRHPGSKRPWMCALFSTECSAELLIAFKWTTKRVGERVRVSSALFPPTRRHPLCRFHAYRWADRAGIYGRGFRPPVVCIKPLAVRSVRRTNLAAKGLNHCGSCELFSSSMLHTFQFLIACPMIYHY